ncbi:MAG: helix-turn-helix domain-containing protein [Pseudomonadota bacterium]
MSIPQDISGDKLGQIRKAALDVFLLYGFKRTSMEDIAQAAGISRAALYLHFRNKRDIFRSLTLGLYEQGQTRLQATLDASAPVAETLSAALRAKDDGTIDRVLNSPHGVELMGVGQEAASDIVKQSEAALSVLLASYFQSVADNRGIAPQTPPEELAEHIKDIHLSLMKGGKLDAKRYSLLGRTAAALLGVD